MNLSTLWWRVRAIYWMWRWGYRWTFAGMWKYAIALDDYRIDGETPRTALREDLSYD